MFEKKEPQIFEENEKEGYKVMAVMNIEDLAEMIKMEIEISGRDNEKENGVTKISRELRDEVVFYIDNNFEVKGLKEGEELSLYFYEGDLYLNALDPEGEVLFAWLIEDEEIINKIEGLIS